jgi:hypothetical protein
MQLSTRPARYTVREVARGKRVGPRAVLHAIRMKRLSAVRVEGRWQIVSDEYLTAWTPDRARQRGARKRWRRQDQQRG